MANPINIIGGFYKDDTLSWACQDTVNYLPTQAEVSGTKTPSMLRTPPGLRPWVKIGDGPEFAIRGMHDAEGRLFVVAGTNLYQISNKGIAIPLGTIPGRGRVSIAHNQIAGGNEILVVNGNSGYVWNTLRETFDRITDPGYPGAFQAVFADGYLIQAEPFGRFLFHSNLADALDYNTLDRFEAESEPDKIVAVVVSNDEVRVFGERTTQLFANTGAAQGTFQSKGITINRGCAGRWTALAMDNGVFFLGDDGVVYRDNGYSPVRISTYAIEQAIAENNWAQAFAFAWENRGHSVYYLTFPDGQTWGYDVSSGAWHRRASYHPAYEVSRRWRLNDLVYSNGKWIGGDSASGNLFVLDWDYMMEGEGEPLVSERSTQIAYAEGAKFSVDMVEILARTGDYFTSVEVPPDQPEGPTITGNAPNGFVGQEVAYQYTITQGDAPISNVRAFPLPNGWAISNTGLLTGTLDRYGVPRFKVRVTDQNGLWDEVDDSISVEPLLIGAVSFASAEYLPLQMSEDYTSWVSDTLPARTDLLTRGYLQASTNNVFLCTGQTPPYTFKRIPGPWPDVNNSTTDTLGFSPEVVSDYGDGLLIATANTTGTDMNYAYAISEDDGITWAEHQPSGLRYQSIVRLNTGRWVSFNYLNKETLTSEQPIPTAWNRHAAPAYGKTNLDAHYASVGTHIMYRGDDDRVRRSQDGVSWSAGVQITADESYAARGWPDGVAVLAGNSIEITRDRGLTFTKSNPLPVVGVTTPQYRIIQRSGDRIIVVSPGAVPEYGMGAYTDDWGQNWTVIPRPVGLTGGTGSVAVLGE